MHETDVVVVGGSVAGCAAATLLARQGLRVTLLEKASAPEHYKRMCTHFIVPGARPVLRELGIDEAVRDGIIGRNPAKDRARRRTMGIDTGNEVGANPRDLALPDVATLDLLVERTAAAGNHRSQGDIVGLTAVDPCRMAASLKEFGGRRRNAWQPFDIRARSTFPAITRR